MEWVNRSSHSSCARIFTKKIETRASNIPTELVVRVVISALDNRYFFREKMKIHTPKRAHLHLGVAPARGRGSLAISIECSNPYLISPHQSARFFENVSYSSLKTPSENYDRGRGGWCWASTLSSHHPSPTVFKKIAHSRPPPSPPSPGCSNILHLQTHGLFVLSLARSFRLCLPLGLSTHHENKYIPGTRIESRGR